MQTKLVNKPDVFNEADSLKKLKQFINYTSLFNNTATCYLNKNRLLVFLKKPYKLLVVKTEFKGLNSKPTLRNCISWDAKTLNWFDLDLSYLDDVNETRKIFEINEVKHEVILNNLKAFSKERILSKSEILTGLIGFVDLNKRVYGLRIKHKRLDFYGVLWYGFERPYIWY